MAYSCTILERILHPNSSTVHESVIRLSGKVALSLQSTYLQYSYAARERASVPVETECAGVPGL